MVLVLVLNLVVLLTSLFHRPTRAAAAGKAQSPTVYKRVEGTLSASVNDEVVV